MLPGHNAWRLSSTLSSSYPQRWLKVSNYQGLNLLWVWVQSSVSKVKNCLKETKNFMNKYWFWYLCFINLRTICSFWFLILSINMRNFYYYFLLFFIFGEIFLLLYNSKSLLSMFIRITLHIFTYFVFV